MSPWPMIARSGCGRSLLRPLALLLLVVGLTAAIAPAPPTAGGGTGVVVVHMNGVIGPASADYLSRSLADARALDAKAVVLRLDTPGGLDTSMREIIRDVLASPVPVIVYVAPGGARAASAGTFILYAGHVAAMAPGTNVGAATPVQIGGLPGRPGDESEAPDAQSDDAKSRAAPDAATAKATNDAVAYIRSLARLRGRNADWAEDAVRTAASLEADAALEAGVIDFMAKDIDDALAQAHGRTVNAGGVAIRLETRDAAVTHIQPDWRHRLLSAITNPNVALILMMIGVYGLLFEFMNPGALYPGVIGGISLLIALYALAALPVSYVGGALILIGMGLMVAEIFAPSFGILGIGGVFAFLLGGLLFMDTAAPGFGVSLPLVAGLAIASLAFSLGVLRMALTARRKRVVSGREEMVGAPGVVQDWNNSSGHVFAHSERWRAVSADPLQPGDAVRTLAIDGLTLTVAAAAGKVEES